MASSDEREGALAPVARAAQRRWWLILLCVVLAAAAAGALASQRPKTYEATTQVLVTPLADAGSYGGLPVLTNSVDPTRTLQTSASILESAAVAGRVSRELSTASKPPRPISFQEVIDDVTVDPLGDSDIISIVAQRQDAREARLLADTYARTALALRAQTLRAAVLGSVNDLRRRQAGMQPDSPTAIEVARELTDLQRILDGQDPNFSLLKTAGPAKATGASTAIIIALGLVGGALLGVLGAVLIERLNRRVRDEDELLDIYPLPVLARVPPMSAAARRATQPDQVPVGVRESLRTLQIQLEDGDIGPRAVMFTSPSPGDGKTTTTINFAFAVAATGARVILLDFDLRKSDVGARLGLQADMMDLYRPDVRIEDVLIDVPEAPGVRMLSARAHKGVAPLFEAIMRRIPEFIAEAKQLADFVIVDTAPLGAVSDALRVAGAVDDVVLVVRPGHTDRSEVTRARELLERLQHTPTGLVIVGQGRSGGAGEYGYGVEVAPVAGSAQRAPDAASHRRD